MLNVLNKKLKNLFRDDEGFAIAMTILVWPLMLLTVSGIFVTGETIRKKMLLQNAADAAAHAGAMIQADTLSRVAVINRMMAWTYIQANKMEMDYTVVNWALLANNVMEELKAPLAATNEAASPTCADPLHKAQRTTASGNIWGWYAGNGLSSDIIYMPSQLILNKHEVEQSEIQSLSSLRSTLQGDLKAAFANISSMNSALDDLVGNCAGRVAKSVSEVFAANTGKFGTQASLWFRNDLTKNYLVPMTDETRFLDLAGAGQSSSLTGAKGISWWQPDGSSSKGFRRAYAGSGLAASFNIGVKGWQNSGTPAVCGCYVTGETTVYVDGSGAVSSDGITNGLLTPVLSGELTKNSIAAKSQSTLGFNTSGVRALPRQVTQDFISKGAVLVGAKYPQSNPLAAIFGDLTGSWFDAHTLSGSSDIWCISAARACAKTDTSAYSRKTLAHYAPGNTEYTAVILPAAMAGNSAGEVAKEVYDGLAPAGWNALSEWSMLNSFASRGE